MYKIYLAGPFFNDAQKAIIRRIAAIATSQGFAVYSPMEEMKYEPGGPFDPETIFKSNVDNIDSCDLVIAITDGKDVGTMFESGYAYAKIKPIIYVWLEAPEGAKFNIMLKQSGIGVAQSLSALEHMLKAIADGRIGSFDAFSDDFLLE